MAKKQTELSALLEIRDFLKTRFPLEPVLTSEVSTHVGKFFEPLYNPARFKKLKDGWIKDSLLGVDWGKSSNKRMNWTEAKEYAIKEGGRLPEIDELNSLVDRSKYKPATHPIFTDAQSNNYWSGTTFAGYTGLAWFVYFGYGYVYGDYKAYGYYVRPVRSSQ